jgi:SAM-dependent methyltransferase
MNPTERFSRRSRDYARHRPGYPDAVVDTLESEAGLAAGSTVVDIGCGTGLSSELFLRRGYAVIGVEPNAAMRAEAEQLCARYPRFECRDGRAEATGLEAGLAGAVVCAQAFHWMDRAAARDEFLRIARPGGVVALLWNLRRLDTPFLAGLEDLLLRLGTDYTSVVSRDTEDAVKHIETLLAPRLVHHHVFPNTQVLDWEGLAGRMISASYVPLPEHPAHATFFDGLRKLYERYESGGAVHLEHGCHLYWVEA